MRTIAFALAAVTLTLTAAHPESSRQTKQACVRELIDVLGLKARDPEIERWHLKRQCNPANFVTDPNKYGWARYKDSECKPERVKGQGAKQLRDALCWIE
jgi:hypothetical protein